MRMIQIDNPIKHLKLLFTAVYILCSIGLNGQSKLSSKIYQLIDECFDMETYVYLPERNICVSIFDLENIEISEDDILNIESSGNYVYKSTLKELLSIDTSICNKIPVYFDKHEMSRRRSKVQYEAHSMKYNIPEYNCIENPKTINLEIDILGFHTYRDSTVYYIEERKVYKITKMKNYTTIDLYDFRIENDVLIGQLSKSFQKKKRLKENIIDSEDCIEIEICWLNKDCILNNVSQYAASTAWHLYEFSNEKKYKSIISKIKREENNTIEE